MALIGVDITPLQSAHRMRGVGSVVINTLQNISSKDAENLEFVFFVHKKGAAEALKLIGAANFTHEIRYAPKKLNQLPKLRSRAGLLSLPARLKRLASERSIGTKQITELDGITTFLQFEQDVVPPRKKGLKVIVIAYDLIPYILEASYLWNYRTARFNHGYTRRAALLTQLRRRRYLAKIKLVCKRADSVVAISKHTKQDFIRYIGIPKNKITVAYLGVGTKLESKLPQQLGLVKRYQASHWGDIAQEVTFPDAPFLLFVGGVDPRRQLADLVAAFNLVRARGVDIKLVLVGDTMYGPISSPNPKLSKALTQSSYADDIYMLGFVDTAAREWLYKNALAFVYPSLYEGFGLPILEAMNYGTPVITYRNSSIEEISSDAAYYAESFADIADFSRKLLNDPKLKASYSQKGKKQAALFSWENTSSELVRILGK